jgi:hypothetical protein
VHHYSAYTLVDITNTNVNQSRTHIVQSNQQQNLNTLVQSLGLRSQPINPKISVLMTQDIVNYEFGIAYQGLHTVWRLDFSIEHNDVFSKNGNKTFHLLNDCDGVAIYTNLEETTELKTKSFETISTKVVNLYFKYNHQIQ